jgi:hypothetical protein
MDNYKELLSLLLARQVFQKCVEVRGKVMKVFLALYLDSFDSEKAILEFFEKDLTISVVFNKKETWENGLFFKTALENIESKKIIFKL